MKKLLSVILSSLITAGGSLSAQEQSTTKPPTEEGPGGRPARGERPAKGERPSRGQRSGGRERGGGGGGGPRPENLGESNAELGSAGIAWYPILEDGLAEAKRTNKPILFMAVASQCGGISGVF